MNTTVKLISLLLSYPSAELQGSGPEMKALVKKDKSLKPREATLLENLIDDICALDLYDAQERYVYLFDRTRTLSLHLFEHVHGESRDRGQAMVDLMNMYEQDGFEIDAKELPDYLPLFLEFASTKQPAEMIDLLDQTGHIYSAIRERLRKRKSIYSNAFTVLLTLSRQKPDEKLVSELLDIPDDNPDDLDALDSIWEDEVVTFGGNAGEGACGPDRLRTQIRASARKPADPENVQSSQEFPQ